MMREICHRGEVVSFVHFLEHGLGASKSMRMETYTQQKVRETGFPIITALALGVSVYLIHKNCIKFQHLGHAKWPDLVYGRRRLESDMCIEVTTYHVLPSVQV